MKQNSFGSTVIQHLVKTSIKPNLYWEIKDRTIEESFNGTRISQKKKARVKVYGLDSNAAVRSRLIQILYERVAMHKDKFIAPILHDEMETMEVKKSGKVEHSDNAHDDQIFSYLLALYVWYDGHDVMENWGVQKNTLKTDEDIEIEDLEIDKSEGGLAQVDLEEASKEEDETTFELDEQLQYIEQASRGSSFAQFTQMQYDQDQQCLNTLLQDKRTKEIYAKQMHIDLTEPALGGVMTSTGNNTTQLPDDIFGSTDFVDDDDMSAIDNVTGNLAGAWRSLQ